MRVPTRVFVVAICVAASVTVSQDVSRGDTPSLGEPGEEQANFAPGEYDSYAKAHAADYASKQRLVDLRNAAVLSGDWRAFDRAARERDASLGSAVANRVDHSAGGSEGVLAAGWQTWSVSGMVQYPQETNYYCGPASGASVLAAWYFWGVPMASQQPASQSNIAASMGTSSGGTCITCWASGMSNWIWGNPNQPGGWVYKQASNITTMRNDLATNVDAQWGAAVNTVEIPNGWRYNSHPAGNFSIQHFVAVYAYSNWGATIAMTDSVANSVVGWPYVQPYFSESDTRLFNFINQSGSNKRGYSY